MKHSLERGHFCIWGLGDENPNRKSRSGTETVVGALEKNNKKTCRQYLTTRAKGMNERSISTQGLRKGGGGSGAHNFEFCETDAVLLN
jgi:hypothetical protein